MLSVCAHCAPNCKMRAILSKMHALFSFRDRYDEVIFTWLFFRVKILQLLCGTLLDRTYYCVVHENYSRLTDLVIYCACY